MRQTISRGIATSRLTSKRAAAHDCVTLRTPIGAVFLNEASYTYPTNGSDQERKVAAERAE